MDVVIEMLVAWSLGRVRRAGMRVNGLTDQALDLAVDRVWNVVVGKLGADPTIGRLIAEARTGELSSRARAAAERSLSAAAVVDPRFAEALRQAVAGVVTPGSTRRRRWW
ncbi:chromosome partitioning protein [Nocardia suismassiliense]|uniref:chromosome partitioning protein n=1 Tax=Nocardia suismassiliense TaxID=2077092 RepID=UPI000D1EF951|nr:chromosome partitioning protein [Nocardia suismassiliense]